MLPKHETIIFVHCIALNNWFNKTTLNSQQKWIKLSKIKSNWTMLCTCVQLKYRNHKHWYCNYA